MDTFASFSRAARQQHCHARLVLERDDERDPRHSRRSRSKLLWPHWNAVAGQARTVFRAGAYVMAACILAAIAWGNIGGVHKCMFVVMLVP